MLRLPVARGLDGNAGKVLTAMRWAPRASWLVVLGGHDRVTPEAVNRVLNARGPGIWATLPKRPGGTAGEPELAHFDPRAHSLIEESVARGGVDLARLAGHEKAIMI